LQYLDAWKIQTRPLVKAELIIHVQGHETSPPRHVIFLRHTIDDPKIFTRPWSQTFQMKLHPTWALLEQVCEENNRCQGGNCTPSESQKAK